jgi:hypothetical protein
VTLSGWATFSGGPIASATDSASDARAAQGAPDGTQAAAATSGAELIGGDLIYRPELADLFIRLRVTAIPTVGPLVGDPGIVYGLRTVVAGVPVEIRMNSAGATAQFGLFSCGSESGCSQVATLSGGYGTTGQEIVTAVPLSAFALISKGHLKEGEKIGTPTAFVARASYAALAINDQLFMDTIVLRKAASVVIPVKSVRVTLGSITRTAGLKNGYFTVVFPTSAFGGKSKATATTRTCLGSTCVVQKWTVNR